MFNVTGGELFMILVVALIVLGPERLPGAARRIGEVVGQLRDISESFKREVAQAMDDPGEPIVKPISRPHLTALDGGAASTGAAGGDAATVDPATADAGTPGTTAPDTTAPGTTAPGTTATEPIAPGAIPPGTIAAGPPGSAEAVRTAAPPAVPGVGPGAPPGTSPWPGEAATTGAEVSRVEDAAGSVPPRPVVDGPAPGPEWTTT